MLFKPKTVRAVDVMLTSLRRSIPSQMAPRHVFELHRRPRVRKVCMLIVSSQITLNEL